MHFSILFLALLVVIVRCRFSPTPEQLEPLIKHAIEPWVMCHDRINRTHCLDVFCARSERENNKVAEMEAGGKLNKFWPAPLNRGQPSVFEPGVEYCFPTLHKCGSSKGIRPDRRRVEWRLQTIHPTERRARTATPRGNEGCCANEWYDAIGITNAHENIE